MDVVGAIAADSRGATIATDTDGQGATDPVTNIHVVGGIYIFTTPALADWDATASACGGYGAPALAANDVFDA